MFLGFFVTVWHDQSNSTLEEEVFPGPVDHQQQAVSEANIARTGDAISFGDNPAVATWYNKDWNR